MACLAQVLPPQEIITPVLPALLRVPALTLQRVTWQWISSSRPFQRHSVQSPWPSIWIANAFELGRRRLIKRWRRRYTSGESEIESGANPQKQRAADLRRVVLCPEVHRMEQRT
jgi:hypothetical protein